jgi:hypothetical protein
LNIQSDAQNPPAGLQPQSSLLSYVKADSRIRKHRQAIWGGERYANDAELG